MDVRAQVSMVFHLDKCIGCHTCSLACKNVWTDRQGTEYMWWNNVETKPGTGYPTLWEDQQRYRGGWEKAGNNIRLKMNGRLGQLSNIFHNPYMPTVDDYYEPWTYRYGDLFSAPEGDDQPTARPISLITGEPIDIDSGPTWDDDLGGSPIYASNDVNLEGVTAEERQQLNELERMVFFYLPRICNHCLNPACVAACPSGAAYKRGEDGIVLISQEKCRAWRMCVSGCPYKKVYYNWSTGKSEKCILCFPRQEVGQAPACFHSCVGRIRYLGVLLYDASRIREIAAAPTEDLVEEQIGLILDPSDPEVIAGASRNGVSDKMIEAAQKSPVYRFVKRWQLALPLHPEYRTLPMLYYVPPLLPVLAGARNGRYDVSVAAQTSAAPQLSSLEQARVPIRYVASLFSAGQEEVVKRVYRKLIAVRLQTRSRTVGDVSQEELAAALDVAGLTADVAESIFRLTARPTFEERFVIPPLAREVSVESTEDPYRHEPASGFGWRVKPERRL